MTRSMLLLIGLFFALSLGAALAQTNTTPRAVPGNQGSIGTPQLQSIIREPRSACGAGSQSVRVCGNDFQSCNSACTASAITDAASFEGCTQRCCNNFRSCLSIRGCGTLTSNDCTSPINAGVRALRGVGVQ